MPDRNRRSTSGASVGRTGWGTYRTFSASSRRPAGAWPQVPSLGDRMERLLLQVVILGLLVLVSVQTLLTQPALRKFLVLAERLEGTGWMAGLPKPDTSNFEPAVDVPGTGAAADAGPAAPALAPAVTGSIRFLVTNRPGAAQVWLLVNGRTAGDLRDGELKVWVTPGARLQWDSRHADAVTHLRVIEVQGVREPALGSEFHVQPGMIGATVTVR